MVVIIGVLADPCENFSRPPNAGPEEETRRRGCVLMIRIVRVRTSFAPMSNRPRKPPSAQTSRMVEKLPRQCGQESVCGVAVGDRGGADDDGELQAVHSTARCRLTPVVLLPPSQPRLDRDTVSAADTSLRVGDALPNSAPSPPGKDGAHSAGWRELHWQLPRDTTAHDVHDGVDYRTAAMLLGASAGACRAARCRQTAV